ncbi:hypothetical protein HYW32_02355 [Candidatus Berkelbacteria bacterium]|nr:hypothetical protein [Candidatus Berkelbacteria bacterium]
MKLKQPITIHLSGRQVKEINRSYRRLGYRSRSSYLRDILDLTEATQIHQKRPLNEIKTELAATYPNNPKLVNEIVSGLSKSSLYAKRRAPAS